MDPKSSTQLDPKLQEAYNRVMGTPTGNDVTQPTTATNSTLTPSSLPTDQAGPVMPNVTPISDATVTNPVPTANPVIPDPINTPAAIDPMANVTPPVIETPPVTIETSQPTMSTVENTASVKSQAFSAKKGMKVSPVILIVGAIVFLIVYTLIWVKVFGLQIPFLPQ